MNYQEEVDVFEKLKFESEFQKVLNGGAISYIDIKNGEKEIEDIIRFIYDNVQYAGFNSKLEI